MVFNRSTKLRFRRAFKRRKRNVEDITLNADDSIERNFFRRLNRLSNVRRFVIAWLLFVVLLSGGVVAQNELLGNQFLIRQPQAGGTYTEGVVGSFTNGNPLYAGNSVDGSVARLVFNGLFKYDERNKLVPDLADGYTLNDRASEYTVRLKPNVVWHDGEQFNADDVVFTYKRIQEIDVRSPLFSSWQGIIVKKVDEFTVVFTLPSSLASFPYSMTNGIVPEHKLKDIPASQLRGDAFNTTGLIGTGPFQLSSLDVSGLTPDEREETVIMRANEKYFIGKPQLKNFILRSFRSKERLSNALVAGTIDGASGLDTMPTELISKFDYTEYNIPLNGQTMVFFRTTEGILADVKVRQALAYSISQPEILGNLQYPVLPVSGPLLKNHIGYNPEIVQRLDNPVEAERLLTEAGWIPDPMKEGLRKKGDQYLMFTLTTLDSAEHVSVAEILKKQWNGLGVEVRVQPQQSDQLEQIILPADKREYEALLYGIGVGSDPDVYPFWHSSQITMGSTRLNLSEYKNPVADAALEAGRTRTDVAARTARYKPFLEAWRSDVPAIGLYQPRYYYVARSSMAGFTARQLNGAVDRYSNVYNWTILTERQAVGK